jgi:hypothetical protein
VTLPVTSPSTITDLANTWALDAAVRSDGQRVVLELDLALDVALDGEVLAAIQLALMTTDFPMFTTSLSIRRVSG